MHTSAMLRMKWFIENYVPADKPVRILDVGSCDVNGSYRSLFNNDVDYVGLDMCPGKNVTYVPKDPYNWNELDDETFDFVISGNAFEHIEYPWLTIKEIYKKLKNKGFACILAPFSLGEHKYPTDCYRYYSDGFIALAKWGGFQIIEATVGGIPKGTSDSKWLNSSLNYDDTMMVITKGYSKEELNKFPKLGSCKCVREWRIK